MTRTISNSDDVIDSRDVIERIDELESERTDLETAIEEADEALKDAEASPEQYPDWAEKHEDLQDAVTDAKQALTAWDADDGYGQELRALKSLADEAEGYASDWNHGEGLIRDSYFEDYARQMAEDIGAIKDDAVWPNTCIDWERAADELKQDYTEVDFDGVAYWIRS